MKLTTLVLLATGALALPNPIPAPEAAPEVFNITERDIEPRAAYWTWTPYNGASSCTGTPTAGGVVGYSSSPCRNQYGAISRVKITSDFCTVTAYNSPNCPSREFGTTYGYGTNICAGGVAYQSFKVNCV
ncbi:hypothetical protein QC761_405503 [Podospora bellae-mahoneyi]|uniref:Uncharacterized protein n=1 Tax=Podospora bellae-mahoneyi TaxID=2093777 RepID=A0ABR0FIF5_9PEZI|nr:hypothetical protein QC761_405503 [Podospora bellae-mahoneyi]